MDAARQASICAELVPGEELVIAQEGFSIYWEPSPHKRGVDYYPVITNLWIAMTNYQIWLGRFYQTNAPLSAKDNLKWATSVPACLTKPYVLSRDLVECFPVQFHEIREAKSSSNTYPGVAGSESDLYNWRMIMWQFGDMIGSSKIDKLSLHQFELIDQEGNTMIAFSRATDFAKITAEITRRL